MAGATNTTIILVMFIIITLFIIYGAHYYFTHSAHTIHSNHSFYNKNLLTDSQLFETNAATSEACINHCNINPRCAGITYNVTTQECIGTDIAEGGTLRQEDATYISWVKSTSSAANISTAETTISPYVDEMIIIKNPLPQPIQVGNFAFSFNLCIHNHRQNIGHWRHILHKGTAIPQNMNFTSWENLIKNVPKQFIGVWIAPFNTNMRIALATSYESKLRNTANDHAMPPIASAGKSSSARNILYHIKNIEFMECDLTNIPINKLTHYIINIANNGIELYQNGKLAKSALIEGMPDFNNGDVTMLAGETIDGYLTDVKYYPKYLTLDDIKKTQENYY